MSSNPLSCEIFVIADSRVTFCKSIEIRFRRIGVLLISTFTGPALDAARNCGPRCVNCAFCAEAMDIDVDASIPAMMMAALNRMTGLTPLLGVLARIVRACGGIQHVRVP